MRKGASSSNEMCILMRNHTSSWGSMLPPEKACFLMIEHISSGFKVLPCEETYFLMRKTISLWGNMLPRGKLFPRQEICFLENASSSWGIKFPRDERSYPYSKKCLRFMQKDSLGFYPFERIFHYSNCFLKYHFLLYGSSCLQGALVKNIYPWPKILDKTHRTGTCQFCDLAQKGATMGVFVLWKPL